MEKWIKCKGIKGFSTLRVNLNSYIGSKKGCNPCILNKTQSHNRFFSLWGVGCDRKNPTFHRLITPHNNHHSPQESIFLKEAMVCTSYLPSLSQTIFFCPGDINILTKSKIIDSRAISTPLITIPNQR